MKLVNYKYDKNELKQSLTNDQIYFLLEELGGEPKIESGKIVAKTICHGGSSHKLFYYDNTNLFLCYTSGEEPFDIFELVKKVKSREEPKTRYDNGSPYLDEWNLPESIAFVAEFFGILPAAESEGTSKDVKIIAEDWGVLNNYDRIKEIDTKEKEVKLKEYNSKILKNLSHPHIKPWIDEGMSEEVLNRNGICFDAKNSGIVIPHFDIDNRLIGIRERTMIKEQEVYGKYKPAFINGTMYNHPLSLNLYNINNSKKNIGTFEKAFVFESEKSTLLYQTYFGVENDISTACCGSSFVSYQADILIRLGAKEIIVGFDKQFQKVGDKEFQRLIKNFKNIHKKYSPFVQISFLFDRENLLGYKDSPIDRGKDILLELFNNRVMM